jgi:hypothetical protein
MSRIELPPIRYATYIGAPPEAVYATLTTAAGWGEALTLLKMYLEHGITYGPAPEPGE